MNSVVNIRDLPDDWQDDPSYVYIGRQCPRLGLRASPYGNPYRVRSEAQRARALTLYRQWLADHPKIVAWARERLPGRKLACWCAPKPCHGDLLIQIINGREPCNLIIPASGPTSASK